MQALEPKRVFHFFEQIIHTPRPSHQLDRIRELVLDMAKALPNIEEARVDSAGNVYIRKSAAAGYESAPSVALQAHLDVVCSKNDDVDHDFSRDPVKERVVGDYVYATGTTLGADNGIGVAAALAILEETSLVHGPLEAIFTADEESDMSGAENIEQNMLRSPYLINLDSEEEYAICIGCAGGVEHDVTVQVQRETREDAHLTVALNGLMGGHSGCDIHLPRGNAIVWMNRVLARVYNTGGADLPARSFRFIGARSGTAANALSREAIARIAVEEHHKDALIAALVAAGDVLKSEFPAETNAVWNILPASSSEGEFHSLAPLTAESTQAVLDVWTLLPHGVLRMSPDVEGLTEASVNLATVKTEEGNIVFHLFMRSSTNPQFDAYSDKLQALGRLHSSVSISAGSNFFPGWQPLTQSPLLSLAKSVHVDVMGREPRVYAIHAGLECGLLMGRYPSLHCISIGPTVENAHSPDERLHVPSVPRFYLFLRAMIEKIAKENV